MGFAFLVFKFISSILCNASSHISPFYSIPSLSLAHFLFPSELPLPLLCICISLSLASGARRSRARRWPWRAATEARSIQLPKKKRQRLGTNMEDLCPERSH
ncbi:PREDICTED: uncharacterized protein LOC104605108 isoform X2 [Nelumbo nucifera]|uniref:Uncharacterized protein LOC104605108 isoform X2 n=1 Tax=Nelumbo nucifera TaxID=4432 RepID=A0A1U8Q711_NELNU|nr:PREDICTED: uncharacterized protein LOC104605108 isoform X2 [Nelumbo nucifera]